MGSLVGLGGGCAGMLPPGKAGNSTAGWPGCMWRHSDQPSFSGLLQLLGLDACADACASEVGLGAGRFAWRKVRGTFAGGRGPPGPLGLRARRHRLAVRRPRRFQARLRSRPRRLVGGAAGCAGELLFTYAEDELLQPAAIPTLSAPGTAGTNVGHTSIRLAPCFCVQSSPGLISMRVKY